MDPPSKLPLFSGPAGLSPGPTEVLGLLCPHPSSLVLPLLAWEAGTPEPPEVTRPGVGGMLSQLHLLPLECGQWRPGPGLVCKQGPALAILGRRRDSSDVSPAALVIFQGAISIRILLVSPWWGLSPLLLPFPPPASESGCSEARAVHPQTPGLSQLCSSGRRPVPFSLVTQSATLLMGQGMQGALPSDAEQSKTGSSCQAAGG